MSTHIPPTPPLTLPPRRFISSQRRIPGKTHILIVASGSVASIKIPLIVEALVQADFEVQVVATKTSLTFFSGEEIKAKVDAIAASNVPTTTSTVRNGKQPDSNSLGADALVRDEQVVGSKGRGAVELWTDEDEWSSWKKMGDPVLHIELRRWADLVLVAPCSANMLAKISNGICDNLATSLLRALTPTTPTLLFPAMNTFMYLHPLTAKQVKVVTEEIGYRVVGPQGAKELACGDVGPGAMTDWREIVELAKEVAAGLKK